eukprot:CAMPEP_0177604586 /NCGR_PEP_ID=MMETSP0419_2-20121207/16205_1 /TAXON_ID=582737 /ORGANISM="Tetraselmis sp., Strain GSL018" /LENGTH=533 /DNA_ID=CAMNT_0019098595 /DNA_START=248 /DNA_END=1850 /DNA_ORIENTATION=+
MRWARAFVVAILFKETYAQWFWGTQTPTPTRWFWGTPTPTSEALTTPTREPTVVDVLSSDPSLSLMTEALYSTGVVWSLEGSGPFTVFAPTNAALRAAEWKLDALRRGGLLANALRNHIVPQRVLLWEYWEAYFTLAGDTVRIRRANSGSVAEMGGTSAEVIEWNQAASNGVVYVIDALLLPYQLESWYWYTPTPYWNEPTATETPGQGFGEWDYYSDSYWDGYWDGPTETPSWDHDLDSAMSVVDVLTGDLSQMRDAIYDTRLSWSLQRWGRSYTVFAPTNTAFESLSRTLGKTLDVLRADGSLRRIVQYHIVDEFISRGELSSRVLTTSSRKELILSSSVGSVTVQGGMGTRARVTSRSIEASNGIVHVIDAVLIPPEDLYDVMFSQPDLYEFLVKLDETRLTNILLSDGNVTVFAPIDTAFRSFGPVDRRRLESILHNHIVNGQVLLPNIAESTTLTTYAGERLVLNTDERGITSINGNGYSAKVVADRVEASNGAYIAIDSVLAADSGGNTRLAALGALGFMYFACWLV